MITYQYIRYHCKAAVMPEWRLFLLERTDATVEWHEISRSLY